MQLNSVYSCPIISNYNVNAKKTTVQANNNNVNFGLHNPQAAYNRALQLKADYAKMGINYVMPSKVWSDNKIEKMVNRVDNSVKTLLALGCLTKEKLDYEINRTLPDEEKDSIQIFDMNDLKSVLIRRGYSAKEAQEEVDSTGGMQLSFGDKCGIFLPLEECLTDDVDALDSKFNQLNLRMTLAHELTHAYRAKFKNIEASNDFHYERLDENNFYEKDFFNHFEQILYDKFDNDHIYDKVKNPSEKDFYKFLHVKNEKELFGEFNLAFNKVLYDDYFDINPKIHNSKQFFKYCQYRAQDEKHAYKTNRIMDELQKPYGVFIKNDYHSEFYGKIEKYFKQRAENAPEFSEEF